MGSGSGGAGSPGSGGMGVGGTGSLKRCALMTFSCPRLDEPKLASRRTQEPHERALVL